MKPTHRHRTIFLLTAIIMTGCVTHAPVRPPIEIPPPPTAPPVSAMQSHLLGTWENRRSGKAPGQLTFHADGSLLFKNGLEFYNPGRWSLNGDRQELILTLAQAPNDTLQIFQMDVGEGVKAFNPAQKQITYHFDMQTYTLDIAGWPYAKEEIAVPIQNDPEPVLQ